MCGGEGGIMKQWEDQIRKYETSDLKVCERYDYSEVEI